MHRERLVGGFRKVRQEIQAFNPDFVEWVETDVLTSNRCFPAFKT